MAEPAPWKCEHCGLDAIQGGLAFCPKCNTPNYAKKARSPLDDVPFSLHDPERKTLQPDDDLVYDKFYWGPSPYPQPIPGQLVSSSAVGYYIGSTPPNLYKELQIQAGRFQSPSTRIETHTYFTTFHT